MEFLAVTIFFALVVGWIEYKSNQSIVKFQVLDQDIKKVCDTVTDIHRCLLAIDERQKILFKELEEQKDFITKAHTDLNTIVKEYEVNGVPLGYDRGGKFDVIEGL